METIGAYLKKAREKKGLTLKDAQEKLKIHPNILKALEEDQAGEFLSPVYIKSFLRSYARFLELDVEKIAKEYSDKHYEKPGQAIYVSGKKGGVSALIKRYLPIAAKIGASIFIIIIALVIAINVIRVAKINFSKRLAKIKVARKIESPAIKTKEPTINIPQHQPLVLVVKAKDTVWMEIKSDGERIFRSILSKGKVETWKAKEKIELWTGNAAALDLTLNGIPLGSPGRGVKKGILITHKGMKLP